MFHFYPFSGLFEGLSDLLATEYVSIEMFTEDLCSLILYCIFRIDWNNVIDSHFKEYLAYPFWVTWIDENYLRQELLKVFQCLNDFLGFHKLKRTKDSPGIILEL